jgi:diadenosine tetraphosphate (Ap4A) HIT family hydrolase
MSTQQACTACRIIRKEIPAYVIAEDAHIIVFLSLENHPVVAPKPISRIFLRLMRLQGR